MAVALRPPCDEALIRAGRAVAPCSPSAGRAVLFAAALGTSMVFMDGSIVNLALPMLQRDLDASMTDAQWIVEIYLLLLSSLVLVGGSAGDHYGRRRVFIIGVVLFATASMACGLASNVPQLIAARGVQGIGGALLTPGSLALISASFRDEDRGRAIGTWSAASTVAAGIGPIVGGWLMEVASWRWAFFINLPLALLALAAISRGVPESRDDTPAALDLTGAIAVTIGLGLIVFGLVEAGSPAGNRGRTVGALAAGVIALAAFIRHEARTTSPMVPLDLFRSRAFAGANLLTLLLYSALGGALFFLPFNLMQVQGYTTAAAGAATLPFVVLIFALARTSGGLVERWGARPLLTLGPLTAAAGFALLAWPGTGGSYWTTFFPGIFVLGLGMAITIAPLTTTVMNSVEDKHVGIASGLNNAVARTAGLVAVALFNVVVAYGFNTDLERRVAPLALPEAAREAIERERPKLAGAEAPSSLDERQRREVEHAIDEAFVHGFRRVMLMAAALAAASAAVARITLERVTPPYTAPDTATPRR